MLTVFCLHLDKPKMVNLGQKERKWSVQEINVIVMI